MQPPFVGPSYDLESRPASVQRTINLVPVMLEPGNERAGWAFEDVPGFVVFSIGPEVAPGPEVILVSNPYPIMNLDDLAVSHALVGGFLVPAILESLDATHETLGGTITVVVYDYEIPVEELEITQHELLGGILTLVFSVLTYTIPVESMDCSHSASSGTLITIVILYSNWPVENIDATLHAVTGGTLT